MRKTNSSIFYPEIENINEEDTSFGKCAFMIDEMIKYRVSALFKK